MDHPRSRGVYANDLVALWGHWGSSPLARGLPPDPPGPAGRGGDHPRSRGVYPLYCLNVPLPPGSSPLARGLRARPHHCLRELRIIPARAGFTSHGLFPFCVFGDYPRSRGVYGRSSPTTLSTEGSSPLARGLLGLKRAYKSRSRIIPARAGFTRAAGRARLVDEDHPRSRGVYSRTCGSGTSSVGSSPLARGLRAKLAGIPGRRRIIPARAGFTPRSRGSPGRVGDHPRSRGVYADAADTLSSDLGSSPLARGLQGDDEGPGRLGGIIPARAGFTLPLREPGSKSQDHPRSRGVYDFLRRWKWPSLGSSPLARGLPGSLHCQYST